MILNYRHKEIRQKSEPVVFPDPDLESLIKRLWEELASSGNGIGVAANQIGVLKQVGVIKFPTHKITVPTIINKHRSVGSTGEPPDIVQQGGEVELKGIELVLINPQMIYLEDEYEVQEGCLSYPGVYAKIKRCKKCVIQNTKMDGTFESVEADWLLAQAIQHEMDHFSGKCFVDHFTRAQQIIYENKIRKIK